MRKDFVGLRGKKEVGMEEAGKDEMDSLFEGMVLFNPDSQLDEDQHIQHINDDDGGDSGDPAGDSPTQKTASYSHSSSSQPLDENLFSDLTLVSPLQTPTAATCTDTDTTDITAASVSVSVSRQISRKKKRSGVLKIGYGRDASARSLLHVDDVSPTTIAIPPSHESDESVVYSHVNGKRDNDDDHDSEDDKTASPSQRRLDQIQALIREKLNRARQLVSSVSAARKGFIARRRKAAEDLRSASITYADLERQLDEACEAEDFVAAERLSESLAAADKDKQSLAAALGVAEAEYGAVDFKMQEALDSQIAAEEECAFLLGQFATVGAFFFSFSFFLFNAVLVWSTVY